MKRVCQGVCAFLSTAVFAASAATFTWDDKGDHLWPTTNNWMTGGATALALPDNGDFVNINNVSGAPAFVVLDTTTPPVPTTGERGMNTITLAATAADNVFLSVTNNATLWIRSTGTTELMVGDRGTAHLFVSDGGRVETVTPSGGQRTTIIGNPAGSTGTVTVAAGGSMYASYSTTIGGAGVGTLHVKGGSYTLWRNSGMATSATGVGTLLLDSGTFTMQGGQTWSIGNPGKAHIRFLAPTTAAFGVINLGNANGYGEFELGAHAATAGANNSFTVGNTGTGLFTVRGGTYTSSGSAVFAVRANTGSFGVVRGWGTLAGFRSIRNNGLMIADGEGQDKELSIAANRYDGYVTNTIDNEPNGTNGWHAVNKGKLTLQLRERQNANGTGLGFTTPVFCWGETETDDTPDLVNSFRVSFTGVTQNGTFSASLLALDRDDVALNTPLPQMPALGLWDVSFNQNFTSVDFECRYDHTRLPKGHKAVLMRWNADPVSGAWEKLATYGTGTPDSPHRVKSDALPQQATAKRIGLVGAFAIPQSTLLFLK